jgi:esterase/lipase superfamily enzyme
MERRTWAWHSPALGREMPLACWGHFGRPVLLFPTAGGDFLECERFLMIKVLSPLIEAGRIKVYACGSISGEGWLSRDARPAHKSWLQARFDAYLERELLPAIRRDCNMTEQKILTCGASIGAYNAVNAAAKHPDFIDRAVAMSGTYFFDRWMDGHWDENYYFNMPVQFVPRLPEGPMLDALRGSYFYLATGSGRWEAPHESWQLGQLLGAKRIPNYVDVWGTDADHDWPTWRTMLPTFLDRFA